MSGVQFLSRSIDYLGDLGAKLRDLRGYRTLAHELIQNADDATDATSISFDVGDAALVVDNDGHFRSCGKLDSQECPWKDDPAFGRRCDFHRFRLIASGDKRNEAGTTGAFGIGFIAVYQITDRPELISSGQHWTLHEDRPEQERIEVCGGCTSCQPPGLPGTRFILPWAFDADTTLRRELRAEAAPGDVHTRMHEELQHSAPVAMLFLKRLTRVEIKRNGAHTRALETVRESNHLILSDGDPKNDQMWRVLSGDFSPEANKLRAKHTTRIEPKRTAKVSLAIPTDHPRPGLLCACLPTEHVSGLPFHVNADFFPSNDRKRVLLVDDYQSEWNRAALRAAATAFGESLTTLVSELTPQRLWATIQTIKEVSDAQREVGEPTLTEFWTALQPKLATEKVIYTSQDQWVASKDACYLLQHEEMRAASILEDLGIAVVHEDLRSYQNVLTEKSVGVAVLNIERLCTALRSRGLGERTPHADLPESLSDTESRDTLWAEIALLRNRQRSQQARADDDRRLRAMAVAPGRDLALWPLQDIYRADGSTQSLFSLVQPAIPFLSPETGFEPLVDLCPNFDVRAALNCLEAIDHDDLEARWQDQKLPLDQLFEWFKNRWTELRDDPALRKRLTALRVYPSGGRLRSLGDLALPGQFEDPFGLAELVDLAALGGRREFLRDLGMPELDFRTYAVDRLPKALQSAGVSDKTRRDVTALLASHLGELKDDAEARKVLTAARLVECADGLHREARECYFDSTSVRACFGDHAHLVALPAEHRESISDLYLWLGVATSPRAGDLVQAIRNTAAQPYSEHGARRIGTILGYLARCIGTGTIPTALSIVRTLRWLPARGRIDRWYAPDEVHAIYQDYLFESQALFLDAARSIQIECSDFLKALGVKQTPTVRQVVKHLLHCAANEKEVNVGVYDFLNGKADDSDLDELKGENCLWLRGRYRTAQEVFWGEHPFGEYRWRLGDDLRRLSALLNRLGVRDRPGHTDAVAVIREVSRGFGDRHEALSEEAFSVLMACWQMLDASLGLGEITSADLEVLRGTTCIPNPRRLLQPPELMFFENRAGLVGKFGLLLTNNVIPQPIGATRAFLSVGVRHLGSAVEVEILERTDPSEDVALGGRVRERRNEIGRVLNSSGDYADAAAGIARLDAVQFEITSSLVLRYRLHEFGRDSHSDPEEVLAHFDRETSTLRHVRRDSGVAWSTISRELAVAMMPDSDPGRLAPGLKEVLAATTNKEAADILDELGLAKVDTTVSTGMPSSEAATSLGGEGAPDDGSNVPDSEPGGTAPTPPPDLDVQGALAGILGDGATPPTPPLPDPGAPSPGSGSKGSPGASTRTGRPVLRSYVPSPDGSNSETPSDAADSDDCSSVDIAGVRRVLEHEQNAGRRPKEMPHTNPGYDVESSDGTGVVVRYIEIKSLSGAWRRSYAVLSRTQFDKASELQDLFWLYVVEHAERSDFRIHRIPNPALKANHFMFDDGWTATEEPNTESNEST